jgi:hypothetical protein
MKTIAVITPSYRDFNQYRLEHSYSGESDNFIQVSSLNEVYQHQFNDYVNKSNSVKMPNVNAIIKAVENNINQLN